MTTQFNTEIKEKQMDYIKIDWNYLEANLSPKLYQGLKLSYLDRTRSTQLSNYSLQVILRRWIREYPIIKQITKTSGIYSGLVTQAQIEEEILDSLTALRQRAIGITDLEILEDRGIDLFKEVNYHIRDWL